MHTEAKMLSSAWDFWIDAMHSRSLLADGSPESGLLDFDGIVTLVGSALGLVRVFVPRCSHGVWGRVRVSMEGRALVG